MVSERTSLAVSLWHCPALCPLPRSGLVQYMFCDPNILRHESDRSSKSMISGIGHSWPCRLPRQQPCLAILLELLAQHRDRIDTGIEPRAPQLAGIAQHVPLLLEHEIAELP